MKAPSSRSVSSVTPSKGACTPAGLWLIWLLMVKAHSMTEALSARWDPDRIWPHTSRSKVKHTIKGVSLNSVAASRADGLWCFFHDQTGPSHWPSHESFRAECQRGCQWGPTLQSTKPCGRGVGSTGPKNEPNLPQISVDWCHLQVITRQKLLTLMSPGAGWELLYPLGKVSK